MISTANPRLRELRLPLVLAILLALAGPAVAQAARSPAAQVKSKKEAGPVVTPMLFYLAKGEADVCGPGCNEWIAAEGNFDLGAADRLRSLLNRLGGRKPPIFFHSPGGIQREALAMGRLLRERGMTAGVSKTVPEGCVAASEATCKSLKRSGQKLPAELHNLASCNSACVSALVGAKIRQVPPGARLGVHSGRPIVVYPDGRVKFVSENAGSSPGKGGTAHSVEVQQYFKEMGMARLFQLISTVPYDQIRFLSRDEIAGFGIDAREQETRWTILELPQTPPSAFKFLVEARAAGGKEFRVSAMRIGCAGPGRVVIGYLRGLSSDEVGARKTIEVAAGKRSAILRAPHSTSKLDSYDTGGEFELHSTYESLDFIEAAAERDSIDIIASAPQQPATLSRTVRLSTAGLAQAMVALRPKCGGAS